MSTGTISTVNTPTVFIIEDDTIMAECIARAICDSSISPMTSISSPASTSSESDISSSIQASLNPPIIHFFTNAIEAVQAFNDILPDLIFLDILLSGPDGFSLLNELASYDDTSHIPTVIITSLDLRQRDLSAYGVAKILSKETMTPRLIQSTYYDIIDTTHNTSSVSPASSANSAQDTSCTISSISSAQNTSYAHDIHTSQNAQNIQNATAVTTEVSHA